MKIKRFSLSVLLLLLAAAPMAGAHGQAGVTLPALSREDDPV